MSAEKKPKNGKNTNGDIKQKPNGMKHEVDQNRFRAKNMKGTMKRLFAYIGNYRWLLILAFILTIVKVIGSITSNAMLEPIIDGLVDLEGKSVLVRQLMTMGAIMITGVIAHFFANRVLIRVSMKATRKIRGDLFEHMQKLKLDFFDQRNHGDIMSSYTNDIDNIEQALGESLGNLMEAGLMIVGTFVMMLTKSLILTGVIVVMIILMIFITRFIGSRSGRYFRRRQAALAGMNGFAEEMIHGQKVIKVFNHESESIEDFDVQNEELRRSGTLANTFAIMMFPIMGNLGYVQFAIIAILGSIMAINGTFGMTIGTLAAFLLLARSFTRPVGSIANQFNLIVLALAGAERIFDILDQEEEENLSEVKAIYDDDGKAWWYAPEGCPVSESVFKEYAIDRNGIANDTKLNAHLVKVFGSDWRDREDIGCFVPVRGDMRFNNVEFGYVPEQQVLKDISFYAKPSQRLAFVGSTGAGKTTIVNLMNRFYDVRHGSIIFDGIDIRKIDLHDLRSFLGMVLQDVHLFEGTIRENIRYGKLDATDEEIQTAAKAANAHSFIMDLPDGYDFKLDDDGRNLSQGQRQLISIARAAVKDPMILILDEATSSIDTRTERLISEGMDTLMKGRTVFAIAHRLSTIHNSNAILYLENGCIVERGTHEQLMELKGKYYSLATGKVELQ